MKCDCQEKKNSRETPMHMLAGGLGIMKLLHRGWGLSIKGEMCSIFFFFFKLEPSDRWDLDRGVRQSVFSSIPVFQVYLWQLVWHLLLPLPDGWSSFCLRGDRHTHYLNTLQDQAVCFSFLFWGSIFLKWQWCQKNVHQIFFFKTKQTNK